MVLTAAVDFWVMSPSAAISKDCTSRSNGEIKPDTKLGVPAMSNKEPVKKIKITCKINRVFSMLKKRPYGVGVGVGEEASCRRRGFAAPNCCGFLFGD